MLAAGLAVASTIGLAVSAQAVDRNCYSGEFCVYRDRDFNTNNSMYRFTGADAFWFNHAPQIQNDDSSWRNYWSVTARVYDTQSYGGDVTVCIPSNYQLAYSAASNDRGSSHKYNGVNSC